MWFASKESYTTTKVRPDFGKKRVDGERKWGKCCAREDGEMKVEGEKCVGGVFKMKMK